MLCPMGMYTGRHSDRHECVDDLSMQLSLHDVRSNTVTRSAAYPGDNLSAHPLASSINSQTLKRLLPIGFTSSSTGWREVALIMALRYLIYSPSRMDGPIVRLWLTRVLRDFCLRVLRPGRTATSSRKQDEQFSARCVCHHVPKFNLRPDQGHPSIRFMLFQDTPLRFY